MDQNVLRFQIVFLEKEKKLLKKKFNIFISQGGTDSNKNLKKIIDLININNPKINRSLLKYQGIIILRIIIKKLLI